MALVGILPCARDASAQPVSISVHADQPGARIEPTLWGIFFEDINLGADGGLYAELVKNRSFEFPDPWMGWSRIESFPGGAALEIRTDNPLTEAQPHYLRVTAPTPPAAAGLANDGFRGIGVKRGATYRFSVHARAAQAGPLALRAELVSPAGEVLGRARLTGFGSDWTRRTATLRAKATEPRARLRLWVSGPGALDLDFVSLFPKDTWRGQANTLRADAIQKLAQLKPGFMRFPGGCIVEGRKLALRYQWKNTIGAPEQRPLLINRWNDEFKHRPCPDYFQTFGLGFYEYFLLCEDIGASPLPILNCGMACQFNSAELAPLDQLDPYIQDAIDLVEFATGPVTSTWGAKRAALGHPRPFPLKYLGIGNEQWGPQYLERYEPFARALKARYPELELIASAGPSPNDERFHFLWPKLRALAADIVDEHCYDRPAWFLDNAHRYDSYPRTGPKVFMGEYAAQSVKTVSPDNRNNWECALAEAAFMTGLERNADVVAMSSYAPLFGHIDGWQWTPNLIWMDTLDCYGTPSYYVQQLFSRHRGDVLLPLQLTGPLPTENAQPRFYATAAHDQRANEVVLKIVNASADPVVASIQLDRVSKTKRYAQAITLTGALADENSIASPTKVAPVSARIPLGTPTLDYTFKPYSLTVLRLPDGH